MSSKTVTILDATGEHEQVTATISLEEMEFVVEGLQIYTINHALSCITYAFRREVYKWLKDRCNINPETYEGGFDSWWGLGSVTLCQLRLKFTLHCEEDRITITVK
jgi:hypothetical protein